MKIYQKHKSIIRLEVVDCLVNIYLTWKIHTCLYARLYIENRKEYILIVFCLLFVLLNTARKAVHAVGEYCTLQTK